MAKKFLTPLGLVGLASDPATGSEGQLYFNTTDDVVKVYSNGVWSELTGGAGGGGASVIYTENQPDVTNLEVGTIWVDSDAVITGGGSGGGGTGGPSFQTIVTSPVSASIVAQTAGEILTLISGENISIVNASANNSITINSIGYELDEIHDVTIVGVQNDDLIVYNSASSIWINSPKQNIINTASAAAYASASAYTDQQISVIDLSATIQTASAAAVSYLVDGAPEALNTLNELSAALNDDPNILNSLLTVSQASETYLTQISASSTYLSQSNASVTYATQSQFAIIELPHSFLLMGG